MSMLSGEDVVRKHKRALRRCEGKGGWELLECIADEMRKEYGKTLDELPDDIKMYNELFYIGKQLKIQEKIHDQIYKSLDKLKELGYPDEKIESIREEFNKPMDERRLDIISEDI